MPISITPRSKRRINVGAVSIAIVTIPKNSAMFIPITPLNLPQDRDFEFTPESDTTFTRKGGVICGHIVDADFQAIQVINPTQSPLRISRRQRLRTVTDLQIDGAYAVEESISQATSLLLLEGEGLYALVLETERICIIPYGYRSRKIASSVTVYSDEELAFTTLEKLIEEFPNLQKDNGITVNIPPELYMPILLKEGQKKEKQSTKVYGLPLRDKAEVDKTFNKLYSQDKIARTKYPTLLAQPVFVAQRDIYLKGGKVERKLRVVIDIRGLNKIVQKDSYPLLL